MDSAPTSYDVVAALRDRGASLAARLERFLAESSADLTRACELTLDSLVRGGSVFTCGNGGSAAHAMHLETELVCRYRSDRRPLPCIYLGMSTTSATATTNDFGADMSFARPLQALGRTGDVLIAFSTSGASPNILRALEASRDLQIASILVSGPKAPTAADIVLRFPGAGADAIQDGHGLVLHALMDAVETHFTPPDPAG